MDMARNRRVLQQGRQQGEKSMVKGQPPAEAFYHPVKGRRVIFPRDKACICINTLDMLQLCRKSRTTSLTPIRYLGSSRQQVIFTSYLKLRFSEYNLRGSIQRSGRTGSHF